MIQEKSGFWDSIDPTPGNSGDERTYNAGEMAIPFEYLVTNGVQTGGEFLKVSPGGYDYSTQVAPGMAWIRGRWYLLRDDGTGGAAQRILLHDAPIQYNRIDRIVLRYDANYTLSGRKIVVAVLKGAEAASPGAPALTRNDEIYELSLARVLIKPGQPIVLAGDITDERFDSGLCGIAEFAPQPDLQPRIDEIIENLQEYINTVLASGGLPSNLVSTPAPEGQADWSNVRAYLEGLKVLVDGLQSSKAAVRVNESRIQIDPPWSGSAPTITKNIAITGMTSAMVPMVDFTYDEGTTAANVALQFEYFNKIQKVISYNGGITLMCTESAPAGSFLIKVRVVQ